MTYIYASKIGCALDCNLENGANKYTGGAATDDGPRINAAMASATAANPITLIIDGSALISGLFLPAAGNWGIAGLGCGTGFYVKTGTNNDGIHNGSPTAAIPSDPGPPAPARGANVSLSNFTLNGNQGNGTNGDSTSGTRQGANNTLWYFGINLMNLNNITIQNVVVVNTPAYHFRFSNVGNVAVSGCVMQSQGLNTDGLHFDGLANDITISNCSFAMGDDAIALNCPEGYSGNIARVTVTNCTFNGTTLMRLYTILKGPNFSISQVSVSNCTGTFSDAAFSVGYVSNGTAPSPVDLVTVSNCTLTGPAVIEFGENFGGFTFSNVTWIPVKAGGLYSFVRPTPYYAATTYGQNLALNNCVISRTANISVAAVILQNGSAISNLTINGLTVQDAGSYSPLPVLLNIESGSIGQFIVNGLTGTNITAPASSAGFSSVGSVSGAGVLATGLQFPNAVMVNEVPYISANSGLPSIKIAGVVEPYPQP
jgi:hypothetical protein